MTTKTIRPCRAKNPATCSYHGSRDFHAKKLTEASNGYKEAIKTKISKGNNPLIEKKITKTRNEVTEALAHLDSHDKEYENLCAEIKQETHSAYLKRIGDTIQLSQTGFGSYEQPPSGIIRGIKNSGTPEVKYQIEWSDGQMLGEWWSPEEYIEAPNAEKNNEYKTLTDRKAKADKIREKLGKTVTRLKDYRKQIGDTIQLSQLGYGPDEQPPSGIVKDVRNEGKPTVEYQIEWSDGKMPGEWWSPEGLQE